MTPRDRRYLERIVESVEIVDEYIARGGTAWFEDRMVVDAVAKRIEEIGEVAKRVDAAVLASMPEIEWRGLKGIREVLAHDYEDVDVEIVVGVVRDNLPE